MLRALDKHLEFEFTRKIRQGIASPYLQLAFESRSNGKRGDG